MAMANANTNNNDIIIIRLFRVAHFINGQY